MATVYLAEHIDLKRKVALKILHPPEDSDDTIDFEKRFRLEAQTLASLTHPNIVTLHDFGELEDGTCFLAMEYVEGPRLTDLIKSGPMAPERALTLMLQVCQALRYAHRQGVIHRDLKPSNLLIRQHPDGSEQLKVVDFGLVKLTDLEQTRTRAGLILGSPHCMSPEQVKGVDVGPESDIYSIGILMYRCLTGAYPFRGPNSAATMMGHLNKPVPTFASIESDLRIPPGLEDIVRTCLNKEPADRYGSIDDLLLALSQVVDFPMDPMGTSSVVLSTLQQEFPSVVLRKQQQVRTSRLAPMALGFFSALAIAAAFAIKCGPQAQDVSPPDQVSMVERPLTQEAISTPPSVPEGAAALEPSSDGVDDLETEDAVPLEQVDPPEPPPEAEAPAPKTRPTPRPRRRQKARETSQNQASSADHQRTEDENSSTAPLVEPSEQPARSPENTDASKPSDDKGDGSYMDMPEDW